MTLSIFAWISAIMGGTGLMLFAVPLKIRINGQIADRAGFSYELRLVWAWGLIGVEKFAGRCMQISIGGLRMRCISGRRGQRKKKKKKPGKRKKSSWRIADVLKNHLHTLMYILDQMAAAAFLQGRVAGRIGLPDPADTAKIAMLGRMVNLHTRRFNLTVVCDYGEEIIRIDAAAEATLIFAYLAPAACRLMLRRQTRVMLRSLRHA